MEVTRAPLAGSAGERQGEDWILSSRGAARGRRDGHRRADGHSTINQQHDGIRRTTGRTALVTYALSGNAVTRIATPARAMADVLGSPIFDSSNRDLSWHLRSLELREQQSRAKQQQLLQALGCPCCTSVPSVRSWAAWLPGTATTTTPGSVILNHGRLGRMQHAKCRLATQGSPHS